MLFPVEAVIFHGFSHGIPTFSGAPRGAPRGPPACPARLRVPAPSVRHEGSSTLGAVRLWLCAGQGILGGAKGYDVLVLFEHILVFIRWICMYIYNIYIYNMYIYMSQ